jgi:23S rRNA (adenine2503-C2)-methyltransferase
VMLGGLNATEDDMRRLAKMMRGLPVKINLIPYNDNAGLGFNTPPREWVHHWQRYMNTQGLQAFIRWSKGQDIAAACGQLATASRKAPRLPVLDQEAA